MDVIVSNEIDPILMAIPGCDSRLAQTGPARTPNRLTGAALGPVFFGSVRFGHASAGRIDIDDDTILFGLVRAAPDGGLVDGIDAQAGQVFVYGPGSTSISANRAGLESGVFVVSITEVREAMDSLGRNDKLAPPPLLDAALATGWVGVYDQLLHHGAADDPLTPDMVLSAVARDMSMAPRPRVGLSHGHSADRMIVTAIEDYLVSTSSWRASMLRLCRATEVSERRIQLAFQRTYQQTPSEFMRGRALAAARKVLIDNDRRTSVSAVALDHDFNHLGRFAAYYREVFGEHPSSTSAPGIIS